MEMMKEQCAEEAQATCREIVARGSLLHLVLNTLRTGQGSILGAHCAFCALGEKRLNAESCASSICAGGTAQQLL